jgi:hypothetical protein
MPPPGPSARAVLLLNAYLSVVGQIYYVLLYMYSFDSHEQFQQSGQWD